MSEEKQQTALKPQVIPLMTDSGNCTFRIEFACTAEWENPSDALNAGAMMLAEIKQALVASAEAELKEAESGLVKAISLDSELLKKELQ